MTRLEAAPVKATLFQTLEEQLHTFRDQYQRKPKLAVVLVGDDPASVIYTEQKGKVAISLGMEHMSVKLPSNVFKQELQDKIRSLNEDLTVDGILIQRPLPKEFSEEEVVYWVDPKKDVDAFHPENTGRLQLGLPTFQPCTPAGVMEILKHYQVQVEGKVACVVGRSSIVGKPMATLLLQANATVIHTHSRTKNLKKHTQQADILVVAAGKPGLISKDHLKKGAVVIDVGIHRKKDGKLCGDVDFQSAAEVAGGITPVPGGVGPMTIALLMRNTLRAALLRETGLWR